MAAAVVAAMALTLLLPDDFRMGPRWVLPLVEGLLLATLIAADPGRITRRSAALRAVSVALISVLALSAIWSTIQLIDDLIHGGGRDQLRIGPTAGRRQRLGVHHPRVLPAVLRARRWRSSGQGTPHARPPNSPFPSSSTPI
jgi:hypothetical protein